MRLDAVAYKNNKMGFLSFLYFLPFLLPFIPQKIYDTPWVTAAETQRSAEGARRLPLIYWLGGIESAESLKQAGIDRFAAPPEKAAAWEKAGFKVVALSQVDLGRREKLLTPRVAGRANVAAATQRPWLDSNGWRFARNPAGKFYYDLPQGKAAFALAEAFVYKADAILKIDPTDLAEAGKMLAFLNSQPEDNFPLIADIGVIDDGSPEMGEVMNLLTRRNLLFKMETEPSPRLALNIKFGPKDYSKSDAADPSAFAQKIRARLGDENRSLRIYGSEIVICRLVGDGKRARLSLLNYSGRQVDSLRVRLRGNYGKAEATAFGFGRVDLDEVVNDEIATEFSISKMGMYAVIDLSATK
jgi:hypothetical protein